MRAEIKETEDRKIIENIGKIKNCFFEKITQIIKLLVRLVEKREEPNK